MPFAGVRERLGTMKSGKKFYAKDFNLLEEQTVKEITPKEKCRIIIRTLPVPNHMSDGVQILSVVFERHLFGFCNINKEREVDIKEGIREKGRVVFPIRHRFTSSNPISNETYENFEEMIDSLLNFKSSLSRWILRETSKFWWDEQIGAYEKNSFPIVFE